MKQIKINKLTYEILNDNEVSAVNYNSLFEVDTINIPEKVTIYSREYIIVHISEKIFNKLKRHSKIFIPSTIRKIDNIDKEFDLLEIYFGSGWHNWSEIEFNEIKGKITTYLNNNGSYYQLDKIIMGSNGKIKNHQGYSCFRGFKIIPNGVTSIGETELCNCDNLTSIVIPNSVTSIEEKAFDFCVNVENIYYNGTIEQWCNIEITSNFYMNSLQSVYMLNKNNNWYEVTEIEIPSTIRKIGKYQFYGFKNLTSITIPNSVTSIGDCSFDSCKSLTNITIPNSVTSIGDWTFKSCISLTNVVLSNSVTSIGRSVFCECKSLKSLIIPNSVTSIGDSAFYGCTSLTSIIIPDNVTIIEDSAFSGCVNLSSILLPNGVKYIGGFTFNKCSSLKSITLPNSVKSIGYWAFYGCTSLTNIVISNSLISIGKHAFNECKSLTNITIPNSVTSIGKFAFIGCNNLTVECESYDQTLKWDKTWNIDICKVIYRR